MCILSVQRWEDWTELINNTRKIKKAIRKQAFIRLFTHCKRKRPVYGTLFDLTGIKAFHCGKCPNYVEKSILDILTLLATWKIREKIFKTFLHDPYYSLFQVFRKDIPRHHYYFLKWVVWHLWKPVIFNQIFLEDFMWEHAYRSLAKKFQLMLNNVITLHLTHYNFT